MVKMYWFWSGYCCQKWKRNWFYFTRVLPDSYLSLLHLKYYKYEKRFLSWNILYVVQSQQVVSLLLSYLLKRVIYKQIYSNLNECDIRTKILCTHNLLIKLIIEIRYQLTRGLYVCISLHSTTHTCAAYMPV